MTIGNEATTTMRIWPLAVYIVFLAVGIPWYWPADNTLVVFGMPGWVSVAIAVSFCASAFTAVLLYRPWPMEDAQREGGA
jgi:hypothetical protein